MMACWPRSQEPREPAQLTCPPEAHGLHDGSGCKGPREGKQSRVSGSFHKCWGGKELIQRGWWSLP